MPRALHPVAWWVWALGLAVAASRTTNPLILLLFVTVAGCVVAARRTDAPWARGFRVYLALGLVIIAIRVGFRVLLDGQHGRHVLFTLPELDLPDAVAGIRIGGPVSLEGLLAALYDGIRIATLLLCVGAANVLADPKRLLKSLPAALYELGVAVTIALTTAPQIIESGQRIHRARRLRLAPEGRRPRRPVRGVLVPVLEDALDRSLALAAAMDSRGYGRVASVPRRALRTGRALLIGGVCAVLVGTYGVLDGTAPAPLGAPALVAGCVLGAAGMRLAGRRVPRTVYRPAPWRAAETAVAACGLAAAVLVVVAEHVDADVLFPTVQPPRWPTVSAIVAMAALIGLLPAWLAPPVDALEATPA